MTGQQAIDLPKMAPFRSHFVLSKRAESTCVMLEKV